MYQVRIKNQMADTTVKLHSRHWLIEDANGFCENVRWAYVNRPLAYTLQQLRTQGKRMACPAQQGGEQSSRAVLMEVSLVKFGAGRVRKPTSWPLPRACIPARFYEMWCCWAGETAFWGSSRRSPRRRSMRTAPPCQCAPPLARCRAATRCRSATF